MSYRRPSGGRSGDRYRSSSDEGSVFSGGSAGGPPLQILIAACIILGVLGLGTAIAVGLTRGPAPAVAVQPTAIPATAVPAVQATAAPAAAASATGGAGGSAVASGTGAALAIEVQPNALKFAVESLEAPANTLVTLNFNNNTTLGVQHNWVLVEGGDAVEAAINTAAQANADGLFVPPTDTAGGLAWTPMTNAGQQSSVSFTTPAAGTYSFICTFPGHYLGGMKGQFVVN